MAHHIHLGFGGSQPETIDHINSNGTTACFCIAYTYPTLCSPATGYPASTAGYPQQGYPQQGYPPQYGEPYTLQTFYFFQNQASLQTSSGLQDQKELHEVEALTTYIARQS